MAQRRMPERGDQTAGWPSDVRISEVRVTVVPDPREHGPGKPSMAVRVAGTVSLALAIAVAAVVIVDARQRPSTGPRRTAPVTHAATTGPAGVAAAYQYPFRCASITISAIDPSYARAELDRASPCWRYGAYSIAVFHRVHGSWQTVLNSTSYSCPVARIPADVQAQLAVCPRAVTRAVPGRRLLTHPKIEDDLAAGVSGLG